MRFLSTRAHGVLDLMTAGTLLTLPRVMGWSDRVTNMLTGVAAGTVAYSLMTRYEFGLVKVLPMRVHLALDALNGAALCASPLLLRDEGPEVHQALVGIGLMELGAALTTRTEPEPHADWSQAIPEAAESLRHAVYDRLHRS